MADNTHDSYKKLKSLEPTRALPEDEVESARILLREGLIEEAKKTLYRVLTQKPRYADAIKLLKQIDELEMHALFQPSRRAVQRHPKFEDPDPIIAKLERDLNLEPEAAAGHDERWVTPQALKTEDRVDLAVAFFEMGCYADALRELIRIEKKIRIENTFLGSQGVAVVGMIAQSLVNLDRAYEAKIKLEPVLNEADLNHEDKLTLYYCMGICEQALGHPNLALGWYQKISETDVDFRDIRVRIKLIT
ncbi:MAG: hypothetical protein JST80_09305 [Bdellovibrionales bacterium]|nr:hypothetical protein [Bdellovibrionales bacterium]